jgi:subtilisin-like proprotein convertase family protein
MSNTPRAIHSRLTLGVRLLICAVVAALVIALTPVVEATTYITFNANAGTLGAIPDAPVASGCGQAGSTPRNVTFTVSGLTGTVTGVKVNVTGTHPWVGDVQMDLIAPTGPMQLLFAHTGSITATGCGDSSDFAGPYTFSDTASAPPSGGWWQAATVAGAAVAVASGVYRSVATGGAGAVNPAPPTTLSAPFIGLAPNGTWTLRVMDSGGGDTGSITAASIQIATTTSGGPPLVDYDGDSVTDYTIARASGGGITWYTLNTLGVTATVWGTAATDFPISGDYDGDDKSDIGVWRPGSPATFWIRKSSDGGLIAQAWGTTNDDSAVPGDYDGDGKSDFAVFRCPPFGGPAGQCYFYVLRSSNGTALIQPWGFGVDGDYFAAPGDYNGDGRADFALQTAAPGNPTAGIFYILYTSGGSFTLQWGNSSDFIVPGDYDGDGKTDLAVRRTVSGARQYWVRRSSDGGLIFQVWGITGDISVPGDYDGDGKTDFAIWRPSATPGQTAFWVRRSSDTGTTIQQWGLQADFPVAAFTVH